MKQGKKEKNMYDYIIVGVGSAGCVLANRLTEDPETSVLVLEAGGNDDDVPEIHNPADAPKLLQSAVDWAYFTEEEPYLNHRKIYWPRGKVLGGSSSTNFMAYVRGHRHDYDHWQELGNEGWSYNEILPYFKKAEHYEGGASEYRGREGPLTVIDLPAINQAIGLPAINPLTSAFLEACGELGWSRNDDYNGASQEGFGTLQFTIRQGQRQSTAVAYLHPVMSRPNLTVWTQTLVTRILFEGTHAVGVAYLKDGVEQQERVKKEVILSSGAINSPQTLLLSGVGPADQLRELGIKVVADLAGVGSNLQDHPNVPVYDTTKPSFSQFGHAVAAEGNAFVKTQQNLLEPNIQILFLPYFYPPETGNGYTHLIILGTLQSRGHVTLRSTDPTQHPAIYANYLSSETDLQALVEGVKLARRLGHAKAFAPFYEGDAYAGPQIQSEKEIIEYIRSHVQPMYHPGGTCKMGHDDLAVVDEQLHVRGVEGLRVVDASIMPTLPNGNINAAVIMIAEKAADLLSGHKS